MKLFLKSLPLLIASWSVGLAKPLPESTVAQAAARIDRLIFDDLEKAKLKPTATLDDATFLRRAYLGIVGRIPSAAEARAFLDDKESNKRDLLVDQLVASPGFDSHLFNWTADLLRVQTRQDQFGLGWHVWLRRSLAEDKPWDALVSEMLTSTGHCSTDPAVGYYLRDRNMQLDNFSNTMQVFLGRQIGCAQCHDHPFDDWSQYEYYQMASFGGGIGYRSSEAQETIQKVTGELAAGKLGKAPPIPGNTKKGKPNSKLKQQRREQANLSRSISNQLRPLFKDLGKNAIVDDPSSKLRLPADYKYPDAKPGDAVKPETLFGPKVTDISAENRRDSFAAWVVSPENPYFTKAIANRLWQRVFGHGMLDSVDNLNDSSKSCHPELMAYLETTMKGADYDLRQFLRILYRTRLFQRECLTEEPVMGEPLAFRGPVLTRMTAEQLYDSFIVLTRGEINDSSSPALEKSWEAYGKQVHDLLNAETHDLMILAESAKQGEQLQRKAQSDVRAAQKALSDAKDKQARNKAQVAFQEARERFIEARRQADPFRSMQMGKKAGKKDGGDHRASEMPAPFNPGSLVREFGGSDRQTPSSGNTEATIPQALALLNNPKTDIISGKRSYLNKELTRMDSAEDRLDFLFLSLFGERPTAQEKDRYLAKAKDKATLRDLASAMLTSNRFIFIQ
jgi:Protein of unknown function (DUF1549)/Protein of unknown function (DUF1553)